MIESKTTCFHTFSKYGQVQQTSIPKHKVPQGFKKSDTIQAEYRIKIISMIFPAKCTYHQRKIVSTKAHDQFLLHQEIFRQRLLHH
jgi:hypothetical protein